MDSKEIMESDASIGKLHAGIGKQRVLIDV